MVQNEEDEVENETISTDVGAPNLVAVPVFNLLPVFGISMPDQEVKIEYDDDAIEEIPIEGGQEEASEDAELSDKVFVAT